MKQNNYEVEYINMEKMEKIIASIYTDALGDDAQRYEDVIDEQAYYMAASINLEMGKYCHQKDTHMDGNFCDIRYDWNHPNFVKSEIEPKGDFDEVVKNIDEATISIGELEKFQQWAIDFFFTAFGTYNLKYKFQEFIAEMEYEEEQ